MAGLARLYQLDALGIVDEDLIDEVGSGLFQRCRSILMVTGARQVDCPQCGALIESQEDRWSRKNPVVCTRCGFKASYGQWRDSWRKRELMGGNAVVEFKAYYEAYPRAKTPAEKLLLIDRLIHAFHFSLRQSRTFRPVAPQLIDGSPEAVLGFLDRLSGIDYTTSSLNATSDEWQKNLDTAMRELPFLVEHIKNSRQEKGFQDSEE